jgi:hypothetical protein
MESTVIYDAGPGKAQFERPVVAEISCSGVLLRVRAGSYGAVRRVGAAQSDLERADAMLALVGECARCANGAALDPEDLPLEDIAQICSAAMRGRAADFPTPPGACTTSGSSESTGETPLPG